MDQQARNARAFAALHTPGKPLVLYNVWDAGSANAVSEAGAAAIATGSWAIAAAQGYPDGERIPLELLLTIVERIVASVELPVSVDIEGGYGKAPGAVARTAKQVIAAGAIGVNFEDRIVDEAGLYDTDEQSSRIGAVREAAESSGVPLFINARTDIFLRSSVDEHSSLLDSALERASIYRAAGADSLFVPGLMETDLIARLCQASPLPVNVMVQQNSPTLDQLARTGVARISHGPGPYVAAMQRLTEIASGSVGAS